MARIRSIKPEFWKSEAIACHTFRARLTFIGLWTYVDDNGVGVDNPMLIAAELFALEEDPREARENVREDLASLAATGRITRYTVDGKPYLAITNWSEHQKIDRPGKPRYPGPDDPRAVHQSGPTSTNTNPRGTLDASPRAPIEPLATPSRPEQGTEEQGTEEQGEKTSALIPASAPRRRTLTDADVDRHPDFVAFWDAYPRKTDKGHARKAWAKAVRKGVDPAAITAAAKAFRDDPNRTQQFTAHPATWLNGERWADQPTDPPRNGVAVRNGTAPASPGSQRYAEAMALAEDFDRQQMTYPPGVAS